MGKVLKDWNGNEIGVVPDKGENPMLIYGRGPIGSTCAGGAHIRHEYYRGVWYYKCALRKHTRGAGSDHRGSWPACAKFVRKVVED